MSAKHTPGEWVVGTNALSNYKSEILAPPRSARSKTQIVVARIPTPPGHPEEHVANANLIAAAPALADALEKLVGLLNGGFINIECTKGVAAEMVAAEQAASEALVAAGRLPGEAVRQ